MLNILIWVIVILVVIGGAVALVVAGIGAMRRDTEDDPLMARLADATQRGMWCNPSNRSRCSSRLASVSFCPYCAGSVNFQPVLPPEGLGGYCQENRAGRKSVRECGCCNLAGFPLCVCVGLGRSNALYFPDCPSKWPFLRIFLIVTVLTVIGFFIPQLMLQSRIGARQKDIRKAMPDALDLLTICVEAGLGFDAAMSKVSEKWDNELSKALLRTIREIQLGKTRRDA